MRLIKKKYGECRNIYKKQKGIIYVDLTYHTSANTFEKQSPRKMALKLA